MDRRLTVPDPAAFPEVFRELIAASRVYDSSCSPEARVWFLDREEGLYLKTAPKGSLRREADMTAFFCGKGLAAEVLRYESLDKDWLLTRAVPGEDCTFRGYLEDPKRLSALLGEKLRMLHEVSTAGCPVTDHTGAYLATVAEGQARGRFDGSYFHREGLTEAAARRIIPETAPLLKNEVLLHGDYCLPNVMLEDWRFSGFIDLDHGGIGDRHIDLFWGAWSLGFNLGTDRWRDRFLDAYGRDIINEELLRAIGAFEAFG